MSRASRPTLYGVEGFPSPNKEQDLDADRNQHRHNCRSGGNRITDCGVLVPRLLTLDQAATYLGLTKDALKAKVHMGRVPTVDLDKKLRFDRHDLDNIIEKSKKVA